MFRLQKHLKTSNNCKRRRKTNSRMLMILIKSLLRLSLQMLLRKKSCKKWRWICLRCLTRRKQHKRGQTLNKSPKMQDFRSRKPLSPWKVNLKKRVSMTKWKVRHNPLARPSKKVGSSQQRKRAKQNKKWTKMLIITQNLKMPRTRRKRALRTLKNKQRRDSHKLAGSSRV